MFVHGGGQHWWEKLLWQSSLTLLPPVRAQLGRSQGAVRAQSPREACLVLLVGSELKRKEIADRVGMQSRSGYLSRLLAELVEDGLIERTIPDKPNSSQQRYRLTDKGRQVCSAHKG